MQTKVFLANIYCSEEFNQGLDNQRIWLSMIDILLGITAIVGNTVILSPFTKKRHFINLPKYCFAIWLQVISALASYNLFPVLIGSPFSKGDGKFVALSFRPYTIRHHFDRSIIVDNNRHKRGQTFGSVVKIQVQTGNPQKSLRCCYSFMGL